MHYVLDAGEGPWSRDTESSSACLDSAAGLSLANCTGDSPGACSPHHPVAVAASTSARGRRSVVFGSIGIGERLGPIEEK